jgi:hypothetical protein
MKLKRLGNLSNVIFVARQYGGPLEILGIQSLSNSSAVNIAKLYGGIIVTQVKIIAIGRAGKHLIEKDC